MARHIQEEALLTIERNKRGTHHFKKNQRINRRHQTRWVSFLAFPEEGAGANGELGTFSVKRCLLLQDRSRRTVVRFIVRALGIASVSGRKAGLEVIC